MDHIGVEIAKYSFETKVRQGNGELLDIKATYLNDLEAKKLIGV